jgi:hypothetical protein
MDIIKRLFKVIKLIVCCALIWVLTPLFMLGLIIEVLVYIFIGKKYNLTIAMFFHKKLLDYIFHVTT